MKTLPLFALAALLVCAAANAQSACDDAKANYGHSKDDLMMTLKGYQSCVEKSGGHKDCAAEFHRVLVANDEQKAQVRVLRAACK
jgi:hypothetical protein